MSIFRLKPFCTDYIWGGNRLRNEYGIDYDGERVAEAWVLSCHPDGSCIIDSGDFKGMPLPSFIEKQGRQILGSSCSEKDDFPIITKLIDARDNLSIQVHPNNNYALENEGQAGKTEMWYVIDADPDSYIYYGVNRDVTVDELRERINNNTITEVLNKVPATKGDVFFIPAGTLHAICKGLLIAEVQQNSNVTYRVYDYARKDVNGNQRELHIDKALAVARRTPNFTSYNYGGHLVSCAYFTTDIINGSCIDNADSKSFVSLVVLSGTCKIIEKNTGDILEAKKGDSFFVTADSGEFEISGEDVMILKTQIGDR